MIRATELSVPPHHAPTSEPSSRRSIVVATLLFGLVAVLVGGVLHAGHVGTEPPVVPEFTLDGRVLRPGSGTSAAGEFVLATTGAARDELRGEDFALTDPGERMLATKSGGSCLCQGLFTDGFESGDTSAWSASAP